MDRNADFIIGTTITPWTIAVIEKDVGIIAASLIVMRPCFVAVSNTVWRRSQTFTPSFTKSDAQGTPLSASTAPPSALAAPPKTGIIRITEVEMQSKPRSISETRPRDLPFDEELGSKVNKYHK